MRVRSNNRHPSPAIFARSPNLFTFHPLRIFPFLLRPPSWFVNEKTLTEVTECYPGWNNKHANTSFWEFIFSSISTRLCIVLGSLITDRRYQSKERMPFVEGNLRIEDRIHSVSGLFISFALLSRSFPSWKMRDEKIGRTIESRWTADQNAGICSHIDDASDVLTGDFLDDSDGLWRVRYSLWYCSN